MFSYLSNLFRKPTATQLAQSELEDCKRNLLKELTAGNYHTKMAEYYQENINRLSAYVTRN